MAPTPCPRASIQKLVLVAKITILRVAKIPPSMRKGFLPKRSESIPKLRWWRALTRVARERRSPISISLKPRR